MSVKIIITDQNLQVVKRETNGQVSETLTYVNPSGLPTPGTKGSVPVSDGTNFINVTPGSNDQYLVADSTKPSGVKWVDRAGRNITIPLTQPFASTSLANPQVYSAIYWIPPDVTQVFASLGLRDLYTPAGNAADVNNMKIVAGQPSADRQSFVGTPTTYTGITVPAFMQSSKVSFTPDRDANGYMMFRWTVPSGTNYIEYVTNAGQSGYVKTIANSTDPTVGVGWSDTEQPAGQFLISYATSQPKLVIWSDSIQRGVAGTNQCGLLNSLVGLGPSLGYAVSAMGVASTRLSVWSAYSNWMLNDTSPVAGATVLIALGTNDIAASATATTMIGQMKALVRDAWSLGAKRVIVATVPPSSAFSGPQNTELALFNAWVRAPDRGWFEVLDVHTLLKDPGTPTQLLGAYAATGGVHITTAAMTVLKGALQLLT